MSRVAFHALQICFIRPFFACQIPLTGRCLFFADSPTITVFDKIYDGLHFLLFQLLVQSSLVIPFPPYVNSAIQISVSTRNSHPQVGIDYIVLVVYNPKV